jgi:aspartyl-tRNA(Asn)/glutamyl-tRNA(Gln) amidotransferase subunit C
VTITRDDVLHVARLARLEIPEDEVDRVRDELGAILDAVGKVAELDLSDVEPTSHPLAVVNVWREDEPRPSLSLEDALANAPDPVDGAFRVPAVGS